MNNNTAEKIEPTPELIQKHKLIKTEAGGWRYPPNPLECLAESGALGDGVKAGYRLEAAARFVNDFEAVYFVRRPRGDAKDGDTLTPFDRLVGLQRRLSGGDYWLLEAVAAQGKDIDDIIASFPVLNRNAGTKNALVGRLCRILDAVYEYYSQ